VSNIKNLQGWYCLGSHQSGRVLAKGLETSVITRPRHTLAESRPTLECSSGVYVTVINSELLFLGEHNGFPMAFLSTSSSLITAKWRGPLWSLD
jgi:hypothetical protein